MISYEGAALISCSIAASGAVSGFSCSAPLPPIPSPGRRRGPHALHPLPALRQDARGAHCGGPVPARAGALKAGRAGPRAGGCGRSRGQLKLRGGLLAAPAAHEIAQLRGHPCVQALGVSLRQGEGKAMAAPRGVDLHRAAPCTCQSTDASPTPTPPCHQCRARARRCPRPRASRPSPASWTAAAAAAAGRRRGPSGRCTMCMRWATAAPTRTTPCLH